MKNTYFISLLFFLFISYGCIEEFTPDIPDSGTAIVIEGNILQGTNGARVLVSTSAGINRNTFTQLDNAAVVIRDDSGVEHQLQNMGEGLYISDTSVFRGIPGRSYQLSVTINQGASFESTWMLMRPGVEIRDIGVEWEEKQDDLGSLQGVQLYVDTEEAEGDMGFFRWEFEETWIFRVPYAARGVWNTQTNLPEPFDNNFRPQTCWSSQTSSAIRIASTDELSENRVANYPLRFVSTRGNQLRSRYSILVKQYTIDSETHEFWRRLKEVTEELGGLFDPVPTKVNGNMSATNGATIPVIGFFSADGYTEKRIFIERADLPLVPISSGFESCEYDTVERFEVNTEIIMGNAYVEDIYSITGALIGFGVTQAICADCRISGSIERPDFWD